MSAFRGIIPPLCTPLDDAGMVDSASLERLVQRQLDAGVHGLFVLGSSGEAIYLDDRARSRALEVVVSTVAGAVPVLAGALAGSTARVIEQARWIERLPVDAVVVTAPFYAHVNDAEIATHFETVASAIRVPVIAYDIPGNVGRKLSTEVVIDLLRREVIAGLKDTSGDMPGFRRIIDGLGNRPSSVMTGSDSLAAEALAAGAHGIVPGIGNVCPDLFVDLYAAHGRGDTVIVERLQGQISVMASVFAVGGRHGMGRHASELGVLKYLLHRDGVIQSPVVSIPLAPYPAAAAAEVRAIVEAIGR